MATACRDRSLYTPANPDGSATGTLRGTGLRFAMTFVHGGSPYHFWPWPQVSPLLWLMEGAFFGCGPLLNVNTAKPEIPAAPDGIKPGVAESLGAD